MKALHLWFSRKLSCNQISIIFDVVFFTFPGSSVTFVQTQRPATAEILRRTQHFSPSFYYFFSIYLTCFLSLSPHHHFFPYPSLLPSLRMGASSFQIPALPLGKESMNSSILVLSEGKKLKFGKYTWHLISRHQSWRRTLHRKG